MIVVGSGKTDSSPVGQGCEWEVQVYLDPPKGEALIFQEGITKKFSFLELRGRLSCEVYACVDEMRRANNVEKGTCVSGRIYPPGSWGDPGAEFLFEVRVEI